MVSLRSVSKVRAIQEVSRVELVGRGAGITGLPELFRSVLGTADVRVLVPQAPVMLFRSLIGLAMVRSVSKPSPVPRIVTVP